LARDLLYYINKETASKIKQGGVMKNLTIDEILTQMFRDTANRVGWNIFRKGKRATISPKRNMVITGGNLKKLH
jgi:hypothetical protein